ncbi:hypothetical protein ACFV2C_08340 [[Kitasatospora] papulosa]|uniref:hypothetical protein n=1 Tax=[Kitasatospora] papulosa TaxID=1464011 RepID=UPI0036A07440
MRHAFTAVREKAATLRARTHLSIRFGKLNHCTLDDSNPIGAKCLEDAVIPPGHHGPLIDRCWPARCANSIVAPEHLPIWQAEHDSLTRLRTLPALPSNRRRMIEEQVRDVEIALNRDTP